MHRNRQRLLTIPIALLLLAGIAAEPASALTLQRRWFASMGTNGANGGITIKAYTNGQGSITYSLKALKASSTYSVQVRYGTCAKLGSVALRLPAIRTSTLRTVSKSAWISSGDMHWLWDAARRPSFVIRIVSGTSIRCGSFTFARATRVAVPGLGIDLPVIRGTSGYPPCRVGLYLAAAAQPREPGNTFIYAHARTGMFLPLLRRWQIDHGASMIGRTINVWTSDSFVVTYQITRFRVTTNAMAGVTSLTRERLWLQTSTGPNTTYPKLIVEAARVKTVKTTYAASHPTPHPLSC